VDGPDNEIPRQAIEGILDVNGQNRPISSAGLRMYQSLQAHGDFLTNPPAGEARLKGCQGCANLHGVVMAAKHLGHQAPEGHADGDRAHPAIFFDERN
jgi:hypothetical protein